MGCFKMSILSQIAILSVVLISDGLALPKSKFENTDSVVWFPDPSTNEEKYIPAFLTHKSNTPAADLSKVHFHLYTKENLDQPDELFVGDVAALRASHFQPNSKLKFMVHGFGGASDHTFPWDTKNEFLKVPTSVENNNIILIDWRELAASPDYITAVVNAYAVSQLSAEMLHFLLEEQVSELRNVHLIGFSLGGQLVGIMGDRFTKLSGSKVPRVTGLDPAKPLFEEVADSERISPDSGDFVDVIHTNAGFLGVINARGLVDFYPNGGTSQPGCGVDPLGSCAHSRAPAFYKESIFSSTPFRSCECVNWDQYNGGDCDCTVTANMGYWVDLRSRGKFYLKTNSEEPFAMS